MALTRVISRALRVALVVTAVAGCSASTSDRAMGAPGEAPTSIPVPSTEEIASLVVPGLPELDGPVRLRDGVWEGVPYVEGGAARPRVVLVDYPPMIGHLDGDGAAEAVVLLAQSTGGTGVMIHLAVVESTGAGATASATAPVGDRVQLRDGRVEGDRVVLDLVQVGAEDAMCCPGDLATRAWRLVDGALTEVESVIAGRLGPEVMAGSQWLLVSWGRDKGDPGDIVPTMTYEDGRVSGFAGCNRYFAPVTAGDTPGSVSIGPVGGTKRYCEGNAMAVEERWFGALAAVERLTFVNGRLALSATIDGAPTTMLFATRELTED